MDHPMTTELFSNYKSTLKMVFKKFIFSAFCPAFRVERPSVRRSFWSFNSWALLCFAFQLLNLGTACQESEGVLGLWRPPRNMSRHSRQLPPTLVQWSCWVWFLARNIHPRRQGMKMFRTTRWTGCFRLLRHFSPRRKLLLGWQGDGLGCWTIWESGIWKGFGGGHHLNASSSGS